MLLHGHDFLVEAVVQVLGDLNDEHDDEWIMLLLQPSLSRTPMIMLVYCWMMLLYQYNVVCVVWSSHFVLMIGDNMNVPCY